MVEHHDSKSGAAKTSSKPSSSKDKHSSSKHSHSKDSKHSSSKHSHSKDSKHSSSKDVKGSSHSAPLPKPTATRPTEAAKPIGAPGAAGAKPLAPTVTPKPTGSTPATAAAPNNATASATPSNAPSKTTTPNSAIGQGSSLYGKDSATGGPGGSFYKDSAMGNSAYGATGNSLYNAPTQPASAYGQRPYSAGSMMKAQSGNGSMYNSMAGGSAYGMGSMGRGSATGGSQFGAMSDGQKSGAGSLYNMGSMGQMGAGGSMYGPMGGSMYGPMGGSMYGPMGGSMYGPMGMGSMYGPMGSMYGPMGMGSMYGPMGSMYGPMGMGSMYGPMGSMYGPMGMGSMYGSLYGRSMSFNSFGAGSLYGSRGSRDSDDTLPSLRSIGGLWALPSSYQSTYRSLRDIPVKSKIIEAPRTVEVEAEKPKKREIEPVKEKSKEAVTEPAAPAAAIPVAVPAPRKNSQPQAVIKEDKSASEEKKAAPPAAATTETPTKGLATDDHIRGVVVILNNADTTRLQAKPHEPKVTLKDAADQSAVYEATEVLAANETDLKQSKVLEDLLANTMAGHNTALLLAHNAQDKDATATRMGAMYLLKTAMDRLSSDTSVRRWAMYISAALMPSPHHCTDLLKHDAKPAEAVIASNPIFGMCLMNVTRKAVMTSAAGTEVCEKVLKTPVKDDELLVLHATIVQQRSDVVQLCAMSIFAVQNVSLLEAIMIGDERRINAALFKTVVGGPSRTAVVLPLSGAKAVAKEEATGVRVLVALSARSNLVPRSGNVARFITFTEEQMEKLKKELGSLKEPTKSQQQHTIEKMTAMLADAKELMKDPGAVEPKCYPVRSGSSGGASAGGNGEAARALAAGKENHAEADAAKRNAASANANSPAASKNTHPFSAIHRLAVIVDAAEATTRRSVELEFSKSDIRAFEVEEAIYVKGETTPMVKVTSSEIARLTNVFKLGYNVALLSAETVPSVPPAKQFTWHCARAIMHALFAPAADSTSTTPPIEVELRMAIVKEYEVVADLLDSSSGATRSKLSIASSPLFGPVVDHTTVRRPRSAAEVDTALDAALKKAESLMTNDALIIANVVTKQIVGNDVLVASMLVASTSDMRPFLAAVERDPKVPRQLFSYALGGPTSTLACAVMQTKKKPAMAFEQMNAQLEIARKKMATARSGSVKSFVDYAKASVARMSKALAEIKNDSERRHGEMNLLRVQDSLKDYTKLLNVPFATVPMTYPVDLQSSLSREQSQKASRQAAAPAAMSQSKPEGPALNARATAAAASKANANASMAAAAASKASVNASVAAAAIAPSPARDAPPMPKRSSSLKPAVTPVATTAHPRIRPTPANQRAQQQQPQAPRAQAQAADRAPPESKMSQRRVAAMRGPEAAGTTVPDAVSQVSESAVPVQAVKVLAIISEQIRSGLEPKPGWSVEATDNTLIVTDVTGGHKYEVDEIAKRDQPTTVVHSAALDELRAAFLEGYNTALLTADTRGSAASIELIDRTLRDVLGKLTPDMRLFMSFCALKERENMVLDALKKDDTFKKLSIATSPIFGPTVSNASYERIDTAAALAQIMSPGILRCSENRAYAIIHLVLTRVVKAENDVVLSSMLMLMTPGDVSLFRKALEVPPKDRGLLTYAFGGSCRTLFSCGFTHQPVDESCLMLGRLSQPIRTLKTRPQLGSMKLYLQRVTDSRRRAQQRLEAATSPEEKTILKGRVDLLTLAAKDTEEYLKNPGDKFPPLYSSN